MLTYFAAKNRLAGIDLARMDFKVTEPVPMARATHIVLRKS